MVRLVHTACDNNSKFYERPRGTRRMLTLKAPGIQARLTHLPLLTSIARMAELVDAADSKSAIARCGGSSPSMGTKVLARRKLPGRGPTEDR
jgi:hypothetical protein